MKRKIIQLAGKTLIVSIPNKWVKEQDIKKGDEVDFIPQGNNARILLQTNHEKMKTSVNFTDIDVNAFKNIISAMHRIGYDEIELLYDLSEYGNIVHEMVRETLFGFVVINQTKRSCTIRSVSQEDEKEFFNILKRALIVTVSLGESIAESLKNSDFSNVQDFLSLEKTNNQLTNLCERIIIKKKSFSYKDSCFYYVMAWNLEKIADDYRDICKILDLRNKEKTKTEVSENKKISNKKIYEIISNVNSILRKYAEMVNTYNIHKIAQLKKDNVAQKEIISDLIKKSTGDDALILAHLLSVSSRIDGFVSLLVGINSH